MSEGININKLKKLYFIGIGGIGMSSLAQYFYNRGCKVSGYDKAHSAVTEMLENFGIVVNYFENEANISDDTDLVVYTPAINITNKELAYAMNNGFNVVKRSDLLAAVCEGKYCIAVAGTHGKTTVTAMIANIFEGCGIPMEAFVGGICKSTGSNLYSSNGARIVVVEADEYDRSFLKLKPDISVVTSVEIDHLDIYGEKVQLVDAFREFSSIAKPSNRIVNYKYKDILPTYNTYGFDKDAKCRIVEYSYHNGLADIIINDGNRDVKFTDMPIRGRFNMENFCAAFSVAALLKLDYSKVELAMRNFKGVSRRFDVLYQDDKVVYIDDYAHHPEQVETLLDAIHEVYPGKKICGFFQPHLYSRTKLFMDQFADVLSKFDEMYLLDIYPARELPIEGVTSHELFFRMNVSKGSVILKNNIAQVARKTDAEIIVTIGAGNIDRSCNEIVEMLKEKRNE